ncbi:DUF4329 domain-containing protein [Shewanella putrefaciens]|nr:DUF4329 domain-containing protein [Shewanella putrefaciens]
MDGQIFYSKNKDRSNGSSTQDSSSKKTEQDVSKVGSMEQNTDKIDGDSTQKGKLHSLKDFYEKYPKHLSKGEIQKIRGAVESAWFENKLDGSFKSESLAAKAFADAINPISIEYGIEIGANIGYEALSNSYYLSDAVTSYLADGIDYKDYAFASVVGNRTAYVHTHGSPGGGYDDEHFSGHVQNFEGWNGGDIGFSQKFQINGYMASPSDRLYKFDYNGFKQAKSIPSREFITEVGR